MSKKMIWLLIGYVLIGTIFIDSSRAIRLISANTSVKNKETSDIPGSDYFIMTFNESDLKIRGIGLFSKSEEILKFFGVPSEKKREVKLGINNPNYIQYINTWVYPGITFQFSTSVKKENSPPEKPDQVIGIVITGSTYETKRGIKVGDPIYKVFKKYGRVKLENNYYGYQIDLVYIRFLVSKERVLKIEIGGEID